MPPRRRSRPSVANAKVRSDGGSPADVNDEAQYLEIHSVMLYLEDARRRTEPAIDTRPEDGAEEHLGEALERTQDELSEMARKLRQGTFFAVPKAQLSF